MLDAPLVAARPRPRRGPLQAWHWLVVYFGAWTLAGGAALCLSEPTSTMTPGEAFFLALMCVTCTGFSTVPLDALNARSYCILAVLMQAGAAPLIALVPALSRLRKLRQQARSEDDEERAALRLLVGVVVGYQAVVCGVCACCMRLVADEDTAYEHGPASAGVNAWAWSAWTALSSFTNCGLTLQPGSWTRFRSARGALAFVAGTSFLGNALYPACLRWILVWLSSCRRGGGRARYLLLRGQAVYPSLFLSQQTWLLVATQVVLVLLQVAATLSLSWRDGGYEGAAYGRRVGLATFEAINSRHAGGTTFDLGRVTGGTLLIILMNMALAPVPYVVVLKTDRARRRRQRLRSGDPSVDRDASRDGPERFASRDDPRRYERRRTPPPRDDDAAAADDDAMIDTRLLELLRYPRGDAPLNERVRLRVRALGFHGQRLAGAAARASNAARGAALVFCAWLAVASAEGYRPGKASSEYGLDDDDGGLVDHRTSAALFYSLFEVVSAYGTVGLSLGSLDDPDKLVDFCADFNAFSLCVVAAVAVAGRTRGLPAPREDETLPSEPSVDENYGYSDVSLDRSFAIAEEEEDDRVRD